MSSQVVVASCGKSILNAVKDRQKTRAQIDALLDMACSPKYRRSVATDYINKCLCYTHPDITELD